MGESIPCAKTPYSNRRAAERVCNIIRRRYRDGELQTYFCRWCDAYHFGHRGKKYRR